jgi:hypothetical protein
VTPSRSQLVLQLDNVRHNGLLAMLKIAADANSLPLAYVVAIASRETNCKNILGDFQGGQHHGIGIMQIDIQHHIALDALDSGSWKTNPQPLIDYGCALLATNLLTVKSHLPAIPETEQMRIAAAGYNCGVSRAIGAAMAGDADSKTTGHDYGRDVLARMTIFDSMLGAV